MRTEWRIPVGTDAASPMNSEPLQDSNKTAEFTRPLRHWLRPGPWVRGLIFWGGAVATGATAVAFARLSDMALDLFHSATQATFLWAWLAPPLGLALVAWLTQSLFPGTRGSGIPQTIAALSMPNTAARDKLLSMRIAIGKLILTVAELLSGASIGREGGITQFSATAASKWGQLAGWQPYRLRLSPHRAWRAGQTQTCAR